MAQKTAISALRIILGDQLSRNISSLEGIDKDHDVMVMGEVWDEASYVRHHKKKIILLFSAMRHFADAMQEDGVRVEYQRLDDERKINSFTSLIEQALERYQPERIIVTHPGEYRVLEELQGWEKRFDLPVTIRPDQRFLCSLAEFREWTKGRKQWRMEYFYREMRKRYDILMEEGKPVGGEWNYDQDNRKPADDNLSAPKPSYIDPNETTKDVIALVQEQFGDHFGDAEPFHFAVTREGAFEVLACFIQERLGKFGDYQDAMVQGEPWMFHSHISFYLNCGLLEPLECVQAAEQSYAQGKAPLNAVEGFIRQILGWREYVRGIYWTLMPDYAEKNYFNAERPLPEFFWTGETKMNCLRQCIHDTKANAYAHHIQRLMVLGNFALLAGLHPDEVNEWYLIVYADAYQWVELPNVTGMILYADGGVLASKPYSAGGAYINRMSDYCKDCDYAISKKTGEKACPFNYLYWDFLLRHEDKLKNNPRMAMMYRTADRMGDEKKAQIREDTRKFLASLSS